MASDAERIKVWDLFVRVFHWSFAVAIIFAWLSHEWRGGGRFLHVWFGYGALGLVGLRIVWGVIGTRHARFTDFVQTPVNDVRYLASLATGREKRYLGHNPLGGLMVIALMLATLGLGLTGYYMTQRGAALLGLGRRDLQHLHGLIGDLFVVLVPLHILGVVWESVRHRENLLTAMFTGWKRPD